MIRQGFATVELAAFLPTHKLVTNKNVCNEKKGDEDVRDVKKQIVRLELKIKKPTAPLPSIIPNKRAETSSRAQSFSFDNEKKQKKKKEKKPKNKSKRKIKIHTGARFATCMRLSLSSSLRGICQYEEGIKKT